MKKAGLADTLKGPGPFTVFAPTNAAFAKLGTATLASVGADIPKLTKILKYHVISGRYDSTDITESAQVVDLRTCANAAGSWKCGTR